MVLDTTVYVEHPDLALSETIDRVDGIQVGVVSDASTDPEHDVYFFWVEAPDFDAVEAALDADHTVASASPVVETADRRTYRVEYSDDAELITPGIVDVGGITLESESYLNGWQIHLELPDHDALLELNEFATEHGIQLDILELHHRESPHEADHAGLTEAQRAALVGAFVHGYYDDPREVTQEELAAILGISSSALSGRLRRGSARLIEAFLADDDDRALTRSPR